MLGSSKGIGFYIPADRTLNINKLCACVSSATLASTATYNRTVFGGSFAEFVIFYRKWFLASFAYPGLSPHPGVFFTKTCPGTKFPGIRSSFYMGSRDRINLIAFIANFPMLVLAPEIVVTANAAIFFAMGSRKATIRAKGWLLKLSRKSPS